MAFLPYPRRPPNSFHRVCLRKSSHRIHRIHRSFWRRRAFHGFHRCTQIFLLRQSFLCVPRILWEDSFVAAIPTLPSEFLPQNPLQVCLRKSSHRFHRCAQKLCLHRVLPRNSRNSQKFLAEDILPRISQNTQKFLAEKSLPRNSQNTQKLLA